MDYRIARTAAVPLTHTFYAPGTETPTDPTGTPTYTVTSAAGATVASGNATVVGGGTGQVTLTVPGQASVDLLTVAITATVGGASLTEYDTVEVAGGFLFGLAEGRASDASLADQERYPTAALEWARAATEWELEQICDRSFTTRYAFQTLDGTGTSQIVLQGPDEDRSFRDFIRLRSISVAPQLDEAFIDFTAGQLADVAVEQTGTATRASGDVYTWGRQNVRVGYEYGRTLALPRDLKEAAFIRFRTWCNSRRSGVPDRVTSYSTADGSSFRIALPGAYATGIPEVDGVYSRYSFRARTGTQAMGGGPVPAGRTYTYDPQAFSLFHAKRGWRY